MNYLTFIAVSCAVFCGTSAFLPLKITIPKLDQQIVRTSSAVRQTITQRVDNFDPQNSATYEQHFFVIDEFAASDGPIFIQISYNAFDDFGNSLLGDIARRNQGYLYNLEHRYYGSSHPTA